MPPESCSICADPRQYVASDGQRWTWADELAGEGQGYDIRELEPDLTGLRCLPQLGIGPVGYLLKTAAGNLLWDRPSFVDPTVVAAIRKRGGIAAISASHPHFYGAMNDWSEAFGGAPIHLPEADRAWVMRPSSRIRFWSDRIELLEGLTAVRCGGHFDGSSVLHWPAGAGGRGVLLTGDTVMVAADQRWVSFMRSYPNLVPLGAAAVRGILASLEPLAFDRLYGNPGWDKQVAEKAREVVSRSAARYLAQIGDDLSDRR